METELKERATVSQIIQALTELKEEHGDIKFFAQLPPNLHDNNYTIGMRQRQEDGEKEAFIHVEPDMMQMMTSLMEDLVNRGNPFQFGDSQKKPAPAVPASTETEIAIPVSVSCNFDTSERKIHASDGAVYNYSFTGCGEAIRIKNERFEELTILPISEIGSYRLDDEDKDLICTTINAIKNK